MTTTRHVDTRADTRAALAAIQADVAAVLSAASTLHVTVFRGDIERVLRALLPVPAGLASAAQWEAASELLCDAAGECLAAGASEGRRMFITIFPERAD